MTKEEWKDVVWKLAKAVRDLRMTLGWSQDKLAKKAGISQGAVSRVESRNMFGIPFRTVVALTKTLEVGAKSLETPLSPSTAALLTFARSFDGQLNEPIDPDMSYVATVLNNMGPAHRTAFMGLVRATVALIEAHEVRPAPLHVCAEACHEHTP